MRSFIFVRCILCYCFIFMLGSCSEKDIQNPQLTEYLNRAEALGFSGMLRIKIDDELLVNAAKGFRDREKLAPNSPDTPFYIASIAKSFTAAAIIKLEDQQKLTVEDSIGTYFQNCPPSKQAISIHQLLTHSSGLQSYGWDNTKQDWKIHTKAEAIEGIFHSNYKASNQGKFYYSNTNYILLAAIVEQVSGISFQQYVQDELLTPLQLKNTSFGYTTEHVPATNAFNYQAFMSYPKSWLRVGGGDMVSTIADLEKWIRGLHQSDVISEKGKVKLFKMQQPVDTNLAYGYGWYIRKFPKSGQQVIFHTGHFKNYSSELRLYPETKRSVVVFSHNNTIENLTEVIANQSLAVALGKKTPLPQLVNESIVLEPFCGTFKLDSSATLEIHPSNQLLVQFLGQKSINLFHQYEAEQVQTTLDLTHQTQTLLNQLLDDPKKGFTTVLPEKDLPYLQEYVDEWKDFLSHEVLSTKVNHTIYLGSDIYRTFVSFNLKDQPFKNFAFTWKNQKLIGTVPDADFDTPTKTLYYGGENNFLRYDWNKRQTETWSFSPPKAGLSKQVAIMQGKTVVKAKR